METENVKARMILKKITSNRLFGVVMVLFAMCLFLTITSEHFLTGKNLLSILNQASVKGVVAIGMTFVIIMGGIDLSVGAIMSLSAMFTADILVKYGMDSLFLALIVSICVGLLCGLTNGILISHFNLAPFLVTMGTMNIYRGIDYIYSGAISIRGLPKEWINFWNSNVPYAVIIFAAVLLIMLFVIKKTRFSRYVYAIGGNETATMLSGVNTKKIKIQTYMIVGMMAAIAGVLYVGRMSSAEANAGTGYELDAIAAAAIGGASLAGGKGSLIGTLLGSILLAVLANGLTLLSVKAFYQVVLTGVIIIIAILIDKITKK